MIYTRVKYLVVFLVTWYTTNQSHADYHYREIIMSGIIKEQPANISQSRVICSVHLDLIQWYSPNLFQVGCSSSSKLCKKKEQHCLYITYLYGKETGETR